MPSLDDHITPFPDQPADRPEFMGTKAAIRRELHGASQNLQVMFSRRTWTCIGSLQSKL